LLRSSVGRSPVHVPEPIQTPTTIKLSRHVRGSVRDIPGERAANKHTGMHGYRQALEQGGVFVGGRRRIGGGGRGLHGFTVSRGVLP